MPSSYTVSLRFTLQATGENNNTWGNILNSGCFGLIDYAIAGRLAFTLSGTKTLTTALGATDEARAAFLDVTGGTGGTITIAAVSKGYFIRNATAGDVVISAGGTNWTFSTGDSGPAWTDGANVYGLALGGKPIKQFITDADQAIINYVNAAISSGSVSLPPATAADVNKALIIRDLGGGTFAWVPSQIQTSDITGLDTVLAQAAENAVAFALTL